MGEADAAAPHPAEANATPAPLVERVADALRHQRAYLTIYERYLEDRRLHPQFRALLEALRENTQETIESLSSVLRRLDASPFQVEVPRRLLNQGLNRRSALAQVQFILVGLENTAEFARAQGAWAEPEPAESLWRELLARQERLLPRTRALLQRIEHPERSME